MPYDADFGVSDGGGDEAGHAGLELVRGEEAAGVNHEENVADGEGLFVKPGSVVAA